MYVLILVKSGPRKKRENPNPGNKYPWLPQLRRRGRGRWPRGDLRSSLRWKWRRHSSSGMYYFSFSSVLIFIFVVYKISIKVSCLSRKFSPFKFLSLRLLQDCRLKLVWYKMKWIDIIYYNVHWELKGHVSHFTVDESSLVFFILPSKTNSLPKGLVIDFPWTFYSKISSPSGNIW